MITTDLELRLLACLGETRRLLNLTVCPVDEIEANCRERDELLECWQDDDPNERYDAPDRVAYRNAIADIFRAQ